MSIKYDPEKAIDLSKPNPQAGYALIGHYGPYPSRPCDTCGSEYFRGVDWSLGYRCENGHTFGTKDEWAWDNGRYVPPTSTDNKHVKAIAKHNFDFVSGTLEGGSHWGDMGEVEQGAYLDEALILYLWLRAQGWTPPR